MEFVSCIWVKIYRMSSVFRVDWSRSTQLHMLKAVKKGHLATSVILCALLHVTVLPHSLGLCVTEVTTQRTWSMQAQEPSFTPSQVPPVNSHFPDPFCGLAGPAPYAGPSGLSYIDWVLIFSDIKLQHSFASMTMKKLPTSSNSSTGKMWV